MPAVVREKGYFADKFKEVLKSAYERGAALASTSAAMEAEASFNLAESIFGGGEIPGASGLQDSERLKEEASQRLVETLFGAAESAGDSIEETISDITDSVNTVIERVKAIATLDEDNPNLPDSIKKVGKAFHAAQGESRERGIGETQQGGEADAFRHVKGSREATIEAGVLPAVAGGIGHEVKNVLDALSGNIRAIGTNRKTASIEEILSNSSMDVKNNIIGVLSALARPGELSPKDEEFLMSIATKEGALE